MNHKDWPAELITIVYQSCKCHIFVFDGLNVWFSWMVFTVGVHAKTKRTVLNINNPGHAHLQYLI